MKREKLIDKHINIRIPSKMYDKLVKLSLEESNKVGKIITLSETIRKIIERNK